MPLMVMLLSLISLSMIAKNFSSVMPDSEVANKYVLPNGYNIGDIFNMPSYLLGGKYPRNGREYSTTVGRAAAIKYPHSIIGIYGLLENHEKCYTLLVNNITQNRKPCAIFPNVRVLKQAVTVWGMMNPTKSREIHARLGEDVLVVHIRSGDKGQMEDVYADAIVSHSKKFKKTMVIGGIHSDERRLDLNKSRENLASDISSLEGKIINLEFFKEHPDAHLYTMQKASHLLLHKGGFSALGALLNEGGNVYVTEVFKKKFNVSLFENLENLNIEMEHKRLEEADASVE